MTKQTTTDRLEAVPVDSSGAGAPEASHPLSQGEGGLPCDTSRSTLPLSGERQTGSAYPSQLPQALRSVLEVFEGEVSRATLVEELCLAVGEVYRPRTAMGIPKIVGKRLMLRRPAAKH